MLKTQALGNIGKDAVIRETRSGKVISFSVGVTKKWKNSDGVMQSSTTWLDCGIFRGKDQSVEIAKYLTGGTMVYVEGEISANAFRKNDGEPGAALQLRVTDVKLCGSKPKTEDPLNANAKQQPTAANIQTPTAAGNDWDNFEPSGSDDLPF